MMSFKDFINIVKSKPLSFSLIKKLFFISMIMILVTVSIQLIFTYKIGMDQINETLDGVNTVHLPSITASVYSINEELLNSQLEGLKQLEFIVRAEVIEQRGDKSYIFFAGDEYQHYKIKEYPLIYKSPLGEESSLGHLRLYISYHSIYESLWQNGSFILIENIFIILILSILIFLTVEKNITRHINVIAHYTNGISLSRLDSELNLGRREDSEDIEDEFTLLVRSINDMRLRLEEEERSNRLNQEEKEKLMIQINQSQKMESIGRLAGGVAHDLNNLLTPVLVFSELIQERQENDRPTLEYARGIMDAGEKARKLIAQLLTFSKGSPGDFTPLNLNEIIGNFLSLLKRTIREDIKVKTVLSTKPVDILADTGQLEQVIMNLCINAQDAMPQGGEITIETEQVELDDTFAKIDSELKPGFYAHLTIRDTGCGMPEHVIQHAFEPFYSTKGDAGTGLGLSTVYAIVRKHGGTIWPYSELGKGTIFNIYLPIDDKEHTETEQEEDFSPILDNFRKTILVVEDSEQLLLLTRTILEQQHYRVLHAENSLKGLEILKTEADRIHLLLTDVILPDFNGKELYQKAKDLRPDIKVLFMSGYTDNIISFAEEGRDHFLQKPFTRKDLITKLSGILN